jgi:hypothetical protein
MPAKQYKIFSDFLQISKFRYLCLPKNLGLSSLQLNILPLISSGEAVEQLEFLSEGSPAN